ncbi:type II secretion system minor pseudopilin GspK [Tahibacter soli]|jgi:general secretion pathway protein K|uniref:Type II secretion system protein K n=1 Tax=Tahibacter soli TaxID=2983605 RepID=A0A9X4BKE8_9GAMM|nr:type II secretion system minor pseudopilin GspK [Tahibacter soli]MDC8015643.1 type II secretion system minor pseudopilin GspK [Tahibacter soli]
MSRGTRQRGVALLIALLVVALATVLIAGLVDRGELSAARTRNALRAEQADAYARGLEAFAAKVLAKDLEQNTYDAAGDLWSLPMPPTPVPGGTIGAVMRDMNGCFNLNNLRPGSVTVPQTLWVERFRRLLTALQIDPSLTEVVVDWLDDDGEPGGGTQGNGAEDSAYAALEPPYRAANRVFAHVTELRLVQGVTPAIYAKLAPHVCALPAGSLLNINTATPAVLRSINERITDEVAKRLWNEGQARWMSVDQLFDELAKQNIFLDPGARPGLDIKSRYFLARGTLVLDGLTFYPTSLVDRDAGMRVLQRSRGSD